MRQLGQLALRGLQVVFLTATLPPRDEDEFFDLTYIPRDYQPIRDRTTRPNIRYQVQPVEIADPGVRRVGLGFQRTGL